MNKKSIVFPLFFLLMITGFSQKVEELDSVSIAFKAKLLCVNRNGVADIKTVLDQIDSKKVRFLKTKYEEFLFLKIEFTDKVTYNKAYLNQELMGVGLFGSCDYYLAFNKKNGNYYRLGGFECLDIDKFIKDLTSQEFNIFKDIKEGKEIEGVDIYCLYEYYQLKPRKRQKRGFECFPKCSSEIKEQMEMRH